METMARIPPGFYMNTHTNGYTHTSGAVGITLGSAVPKTRNGSKSKPCNSHCFHRQNVTLLGEVKPGKSGSSAQKITVCSACSEPLPKLCKIIGTATQALQRKRGSLCFPESHSVDAHGSTFQRAAWLTGMLSHTCLFCSVQRRNMTRVSNNDGLFPSSRFLSCTPGINWII